MGSANELTSAVAVELKTTHPQWHDYKTTTSPEPDEANLDQ